jgi:hypothetical protein
VKWDAPQDLFGALALAKQYGIGNGQIGCEMYRPEPNSKDPVIAAVYAGYLEGKKLMESAR